MEMDELVKEAMLNKLNKIEIVQIDNRNSMDK
jgi:hypothetical protein